MYLIVKTEALVDVLGFVHYPEIPGSFQVYFLDEYMHAYCDVHQFDNSREFQALSSSSS